MLAKDSSSCTGSWPDSEFLSGDTEPDAERLEGDRELLCTAALFRSGKEVIRGSVEDILGGR